MVDELTGVNLEEDFFDHLEGGISLAGRDFSFDEYGEIDEDNPPSVVALLSYRRSSEDVLFDALDELLGAAEGAMDIRFESVDVGADRDAQVYYPDFGDISPGYVLSDGRLTFGLQEDSLSETVDLQQGRGDSLDSNPQYRRAMGQLLAGGHALAYLDLGELIRWADPDDLEIYAGDEYVDGQEILRETLSAVAAQYTLGTQDEDGLDRYVVVLTLFPE